MHPLYRRLTSPGPKRILALDGGGVRGMLSLGLLARMEALLRTRHDNPQLRLADYFDLIGGTSTGALIAAGLALGMEVQEIQVLYRQLAEDVFGHKSGWGAGVTHSKYDAAALEALLRQVFGDLTLGDEAVRTGLCLVTKRTDTNSTWPFFNHPEARYYAQNCDYPLHLLLRASTAAPTYFESEMIEGQSTGGRSFRGEFVDGGVSMHNNPAWLLFQMATLKGFPFHWTIGEEQLLLVSVGTGYWGVQGHQRHLLVRDGGLGWGEKLVLMLMEDASWQQQQTLQLLSRSPTAVSIDSEVGSLQDDLLPGGPHLTYLRYDIPLEEEKLAKLNLRELYFSVEKLQSLDGAENMDRLDQLGSVAAGKLVHALHFPRGFDRT